MREPAAFLITWTCHGNWLHGDQRGSVDRDHRTFDTPTLPPDPRRHRGAEKLLTQPAAALAPQARAIIRDTIKTHCRLRGWDLIAANVRTNHVHVVVAYAGIAPETMMGQLKAWSSRRLREAGLAPTTSPVWTRHGSTRYIWEVTSIPAAVAYVEERQDVPR